MMREEWLFPNRATPIGSSAYYSLRFAPARLRHDLAALLAWRHQVRAILDQASDPGVARLKLYWWREELERTHAGEPRHPLSQVLQPVLERHRLPLAPFHEMSDEVEGEILRRQPADEAALADSCRRDLGALFELMARCQGIADASELETARRLGAYCGRVYRIRDSGALARKGRAAFRADLLREHGLSTEALTARARRGKLPELLAAAAAEARASRPPAEPTARQPACGRVRAAILTSLLDELERAGFDLADRRIGLTPLRKLWIGWLESRK